MAVSVKQNNKKETVITVKGDLDAVQLDQAIRHLRYLSITRNFKKVPQSAADQLAEEITASAHRKRQRRLAS
jgi:ubiquinone biosynthesis protein UbiJ